MKPPVAWSVFSTCAGVTPSIGSAETVCYFILSRNLEEHSIILLQRIANSYTYPLWPPMVPEQDSTPLEVMLVRWPCCDHRHCILARHATLKYAAPR